MRKQPFVMSEIELRYNPTVPAHKKPRITCSKDVYVQFLELMDRTQFNIKEEAVILFMNRGNRVIGGYKLSTGGINGTVVDIRIILCMALKTLASGIILSHTHPSGEMNPSTADLDLTKRLSESAKLMDIKLVDHLIISNNGYLSFADEGLI